MVRFSFLFFVLLVAISCQKSDDTNPVVNSSCVITSVEEDSGTGLTVGHME